MKVYTINVNETLCRSLFVKANSQDEAEEYIRGLYEIGEIVLDEEDYVDCSGEVSCDAEEEVENVKNEWIDYDLTKGE